VTPEEILREVIEKLEKYGIEYMITGSFASNLHGVPRTTLDADIVIMGELGGVKSFIEEVSKDFYADLDMAEDAVKQRGMFNIIHLDSGFKIDFIVKKKGTYYEREFERRKVYKLGDKPCYFASPEDTILSKLVWAKKSGSERQLEDASGIIKIQSEKLDYKYLKEWADKLTVIDLLEKILEE